MKNIVFISLIIAIGLFSCKTPNIVVSESLKNNATIMDASGRQGWQFNQVIKFGEYYTSKVKRGWTSTYEAKFITRFKKAKQKIEFTQFSPFNTKAKVLAVSNFQEQELSLLKGFFSLVDQHKNTFAGTIVLDQKTNKTCDFMISDPEGGNSTDDTTCGVANFNNKQIIIKGVRKVENQANWIQIDNFGFEFIINGESIGAVSTINSGRVWIYKDISNDLKLIISSISSSLLLRHSLK